MPVAYLLAGWLALLATGDALACEGAAPCRAARFRAAAAYFKSDVACALRATALSAESCRAASTAALQRALELADARQGCTVADDAGAIASAVASSQSPTQLPRMLGPSDRGSRCATARWRGVVQLARGLLQARARDTSRPDAAHLAAVQARLESQLARALASGLRAGDCLGGVGDVGSVSEVVAKLVENVCPICGNDRVGAGEECDGDDSPCPGLCAADCTCPTAFCGNDVVDPGEECDGSDVSLCPAAAGYPQCGAPGRADACRCGSEPAAPNACAVPPAAPTCAAGESCAALLPAGIFPPQPFHACLAPEPVACALGDDCTLVADGCRRGACCAAVGGLCSAANPCCDGTSCGLFGNGSPGVCCRNPLEPCLRNADCCQGLCELGAAGGRYCAFF